MIHSNSVEDIQRRVLRSLCASETMRYASRHMDIASLTYSLRCSPLVPSRSALSLSSSDQNSRFIYRNSHSFPTQKIVVPPAIMSAANNHLSSDVLKDASELSTRALTVNSTCELSCLPVRITGTLATGISVTFHVNRQNVSADSAYSVQLGSVVSCEVMRAGTRIAYFMMNVKNDHMLANSKLANLVIVEVDDEWTFAESRMRYERIAGEHGIHWNPSTREPFRLTLSYLLATIFLCIAHGSGCHHIEACEDTPDAAFFSFYRSLGFQIHGRQVDDEIHMVPRAALIHVRTHQSERFPLFFLRFCVDRG